jgi:hypothetical protein
MRPVNFARELSGNFFHVPSSNDPISYPPVTKQFVMVTFSVARA